MPIDVHRRAVFHCFPRSARIAGIFLPGFVEAYLWTYGNARSRAGARASTYGNVRSRAGARASTSRLINRRDVRAAMQWFYAQVAREIPRDEPMPMTVSGIRARLVEFGCWRAKYV
jgi:hypothetical protein